MPPPPRCIPALVDAAFSNARAPAICASARAFCAATSSSRRFNAAAARSSLVINFGFASSSFTRVVAPPVSVPLAAAAARNASIDGGAFRPPSDGAFGFRPMPMIRASV